MSKAYCRSIPAADSIKKTPFGFPLEFNEMFNQKNKKLFNQKN